MRRTSWVQQLTLTQITVGSLQKFRHRELLWVLLHNVLCLMTSSTFHLIKIHQSHFCQTNTRSNSSNILHTWLQVQCEIRGEKKNVLKSIIQNINLTMLWKNAYIGIHIIVQQIYYAISNNSLISHYDPTSVSALQHAISNSRARIGNLKTEMWAIPADLQDNSESTTALRIKIVFQSETRKRNLQSLKESAHFIWAHLKS